MNEVRILVRTTNAAKAGFEQVGKDVDAYAKKFSDSFAAKFTDNLTTQINQKLTKNLTDLGQKTQASAKTAGERIGDTIGRSAGERITTRIAETVRRDANGRLRDANGRFLSGGGSGGKGGNGADRDRERVTVDVDVDKQSFLSKMSALGKEAAGRFTGFFKDGFGQGLTSIFSGDLISTALKGGAIVALGHALAVPLAAAITSGVLLAVGGGVLTVGIVSALQNPLVKSVMAEFGAKAKEAMDEFSRPFQGPVIEFFGHLAALAESLKPTLKELGIAFGPVADLFGDKIIESLKRLAPSFANAAKAAIPLLETLAEHLPDIADAIGDMLDDLSTQGDDANLFFSDMLTLAGALIRVFGTVIATLTSAYDKIHDFIIGVYEFFKAVRIGALYMASTVLEIFIALARSIADTIAPIAPKIAAGLRAGADKAEGFQRKINGELAKIAANKTVTVRFRVLGMAVANSAIRVARTLNALGYAAGGAVGHAAEGGPRSGRIWAGEHGPELIDVAPGSQVHTAGDSKRMAAAESGRAMSGELLVRPAPGAERGLVAEIVKALRFEIGTFYGGSAQGALGQGVG